MLYVPIVPPTVHAPSPRTRELADLLTRTIDEFSRTHPSTTPGEVREATRLAIQRSASGVDIRARMVALGLAGFLALGIGVFLRTSPGGESAGVPFIATLIVLGIVGFLVMLVKSGRAP